MISLFAEKERERTRNNIADPLALLSQQIDFAAIARTIDAQLALGTGRRGGRPAWPTVLMIKLLLLQQLSNVSDDALAY